mgnify:CR=1 FL=1
MTSVRSLWSRVTSSDIEREAHDLQDARAELGTTAMCDCCVGDVVTVRGVVRSVTMEPTSRLPRLEAVVFDGSGHVVLVWLGRRRIVGIEPGRIVVATGRVTNRDDGIVLYNPRYELMPAGAA